MNLTEPQRRMLAEIVAGPPVWSPSETRNYNGRARRSVEALEKAGLIVYEYDLVAQVKGNGIEFVERFYCRPTDSGRALVGGPS